MSFIPPGAPLGLSQGGEMPYFFSLGDLTAKPGHIVGEHNPLLPMSFMAPGVLPWVCHGLGKCKKRPTLHKKGNILPYLFFYRRSTAKPGHMVGEHQPLLPMSFIRPGVDRAPLGLAQAGKCKKVNILPYLFSISFFYRRSCSQTWAYCRRAQAATTHVIHSPGYSPGSVTGWGNVKKWVINHLIFLFVIVFSGLK